MHDVYLVKSTLKRSSQSPEFDRNFNQTHCSIIIYSIHFRPFKKYYEYGINKLAFYDILKLYITYTYEYNQLYYDSKLANITNSNNIK